MNCQLKINLRRSGILSFFAVVLVILPACVSERKVAYPPVPSPKQGLKEPVPHEKQRPFSDGREFDLGGPPQSLECRDETSRSFNRSGLEAMPFMRIAFTDMDGDGRPDMIAGSKSGGVSLYKGVGDPRDSRWRIVDNYFRGVSAGAFSSPAVGDLDADGKTEIALGTGGFSSESGKVLFFRNRGTLESPSWSRIESFSLDVGNDASIALVDYSHDGKPDIIACNSDGMVLFFRNESIGGRLRFVGEKTILAKRSFGMYAVPAAVRVNGKVVLVIGNAQGEVFQFDLKREGKEISIREIKSSLTTRSFSSPSFTNLLERGRFDLALADGDGSLAYFLNSRGDFTTWERDVRMFNNRVYAGPASAPTISDIGGRRYMVVGNIDGTLKLFEHLSGTDDLPWEEKGGYLRGIKVSGFSRGVFKLWNGREVIIVGQSNGTVRAFMNDNPGTSPHWREDNGFLRGVAVKEHSTPFVFDTGDDRRWVLLSGDVDGRVHGFRMREVKDGLPVWEKIKGVFDRIKVEGFSSPVLVMDGAVLHLFVGQQDGRIRTFVADVDRANRLSPLDAKGVTFREVDYLRGMKLKDHSSPFVTVRDGVFDVISGDYEGNMRHFVCSKGKAGY